MNPFKVEQYNDIYPLYILSEAATDSSVTICPERGAIAISCKLHGEELFYLDRATFTDVDQNIRGGNPILFPICGQLTNGRYEWEGTEYAMRNHGVARNRPWEVVSTGDTEAASITLRLRSDESTRAEFPFDFELLFTYSLRNGKLELHQSYNNLSSSAMPVYAGFHPYFNTASKAIVYDTDATRYLDCNDNIEKPIEGTIDLNDKQESFFLLDASRRDIAFPGPQEQGTIHMTYSDVFKYVVLWQVDGKPFVCVEPWMALTDELNRKQELPLIAPGELLEADFTISYTR